VKLYRIRAVASTNTPICDGRSRASSSDALAVKRWMEWAKRAGFLGNLKVNERVILTVERMA
jgi:hypothetical protein